MPAPTATGFVPGAPIVYDDATKGSGLDQFVHCSGSANKTTILEVTSGGVALFDYDGDGWQDVYLINGSTVDALKGRDPAPKAALFRNLGGKRFENVTDRAGVGNERWGMGVAAGDFDGDGWTDLYVTNFGPSRLFRNRGDGTFEDVAVRAGVAVHGWTTGATFGDYDGDGKLDLFVAGYVTFDVDRPTPPPKNGAPRICTYRGVPVMCGPIVYKGQRDWLFRNRGDGTFEDASDKAGVADRSGGYGLGAAFVDVDNDGRLDIAVANDSSPNFLYRNLGNGTFEDVGMASGFGFTDDGIVQACMGLAVGDYDNDGLDDFYVTNFSDEFNTLYHNEGGGSFSDVTLQSGQRDLTTPFLGWGTGFFDFDNDGLKDLFVANGHVYPEATVNDWGTSWDQRPLLLRNTGSKFAAVPAAPNSGLAMLRCARGMAFGDIDNDGDVDVVMNNLSSAPTLLINRGTPENHWITLDLVSGPTRPGPPVGAVVKCKAGGTRQRAVVTSGGSFASQPDLRVHFGLGGAAAVECLEIRWPSGRVEGITISEVDRIVRVREGEGSQK